MALFFILFYMRQKIHKSVNPNLHACFLSTSECTVLQKKHKYMFQLENGLPERKGMQENPQSKSQYKQKIKWLSFLLARENK